MSFEGEFSLCPSGISSKEERERLPGEQEGEKWHEK